MSAFKRHQSRVFWNQMQDLDIGAGRSNGPSVAEESLDSSKDTSDDANVTVIRRDGVANESRGEVSASRREATAEKKTENRSRARAHSPASQGHRSQDSGFSDSDRSECSDTDVRSRQRRSRRRERIRRQLRLEVPRGNPVLCNPTHTSTPKQDPRHMDRAGALSKQPADIGKTRWDLRQLDCLDENNAEISLIQSSRDENLADFLFADDPAEDQSQCSSSWSRSGSSRVTPSLADKTLYSSTWTDSSQDVNLNRLAPVRAWLCNIANDEEEECEMFLQHKTLPSTTSFEDETDSTNLRSLTSSSTAAATKLLVRAEKFDRHFEGVIKQLSEMGNVRVERELIQSIEEDAYKFLTGLGARPPRRIHQGSLQNITQQLQYLKIDVERALEPRLDFYIERVVGSLEECVSEDRGGVRGAIAALTALGMAGSRSCRSIARCDGVRNLLSFLLSTLTFSSELKCAALRALSCVCSCPEAIEAFAREGGPEVLADILASRSWPESTKTETAALVVQISAPWTRALGVPHLALFADSLVRDLTELAARTKCSQTLLLSAAALNYLSANRKFVEPILEHDTVRTLLKCVKKSAGGNFCLMEQVASLVGELARDPQTFSHLANARVSVALVSFLRMRPPNLEDTYKRLELTASAALTRLCVDPEIARQIVALGATDCLPTYESKSEPRNDSKTSNAGFKLRCSKSLRLASREAKEQIDVAKSVDHFTF